MKRYVVIIEESAQADVRESYDWGSTQVGQTPGSTMGSPVANSGYGVMEQLGVVPKAFPLAPEDDEFSEEIRQMVVGRYRILFTIKGRKVHLLHVRGASLED
jgi:hypothetical protein